MIILNEKKGLQVEYDPERDKMLLKPEILSSEPIILNTPTKAITHASDNKVITKPENKK